MVEEAKSMIIKQGKNIKHLVIKNQELVVDVVPLRKLLPKKFHKYNNCN